MPGSEGYSSGFCSWNFNPYPETSKDLWCATCKLEFHSHSDWLRHQQTTPDHYICDHEGCRKFFYGIGTLNEREVFKYHYARSHLPCQVPQCGETIYNQGGPAKRVIHDHFMLKHPRLYCSICERSFADVHEADMHKGASQSYCMLCRQEFNSAAEKAAHDGLKHPWYTQCSTCHSVKSREYKCPCDMAREAREGMENAARERKEAYERFQQNCEKNRNNAGESSHFKTNGWGSKRRQQDSKPQADTRTHQPIPPSTTDFYSLLGVSSHASQTEIIKAAKKARICAHPDRFTGKNLSPQQQHKVIELSKAVGQAADTLSDKDKRMRYDAKLQKERRETANATTKPARSENPFTTKETPASHGFQGRNGYDHGGYPSSNYGWSSASNKTQRPGTRNDKTESDSRQSKDTGPQPKSTFYSDTFFQYEYFPFIPHQFHKPQSANAESSGQGSGWGPSAQAKAPNSQSHGVPNPSNIRWPFQTPLGADNDDVEMPDED